MPPRLLVVDEDRQAGSLAVTLLAAWSWPADYAASAAAARRYLRQRRYAAVLLEAKLASAEAGHLLSYLRRQHPETSVVMLCDAPPAANTDHLGWPWPGSGSEGVDDVLLRPWVSARQVRSCLQRAAQRHRLLHKARRLEQQVTQTMAKLQRVAPWVQPSWAAKIATLEQTNERLARLAITDDVTGLYNQRFLHAHLREEFQRAAQEGAGLAVMMLDLDHFKQANDTRDHLFGSAVLHRVAQILKQSVRQQDRVVRYGGDEFVVVMPHTLLAAAQLVAGRLHRRIAAANVGDAQGPYHVTASIGVAALHECAATSSNELLRAADHALYAAKAHGRNCVVSMCGEEWHQVAAG